MSMKKSKLLIPFLMVVMGIMLITPSCTLYSRKGTSQASTVFLEKSDYVLSEPKTATGETKIVFGFSIGENDKAADVATYTTQGAEGGFAIPTGCCLASVVDPSAQAKSIALYNLLEKNPGYDAVMSPSYQVETHMPCGIPLFSTTTVTVTARLIKYKQ